MKLSENISLDKPILDYRVPLTYSLMMEYINIFSERYPMLSVNFIGESILGKSIPLVTLGDPEAEKGVMYIGAHHGMEWITSVLLLRFINEYCEYLKAGRQMYGQSMTYLARSRFIAVVPMLNPDGVDLQICGIPDNCPMADRLVRMNGGDDFSSWQANIRGVDLNHNYAAGFEEYKTLENEMGLLGGAPGKFSGEYPESEPETAALCAFIRTAAPRLLIALHTQGGEIYADYNGHLPKGASVIARRMSAMSGYAVATPEPAACFGGLKDWFIDAFDRPGFTIECGKGTNPLPESDAPILYETIRGILLTAPTFI